jgi:hypothetical protein
MLIICFLGLLVECIQHKAASTTEGSHSVSLLENQAQGIFSFGRRKKKKKKKAKTDCTKRENAGVGSCVAARLTDLKSTVFPLYSGIQSKYMELNATAPALLNDFNKIKSKIDRINQQVNGNDLAKGADSLSGQVNMVSKSTQELGAITSSGLNQMWSFAKGVQLNAAEASDTLKKTLIGSLEDLTTKVTQATKIQTKIQDLRSKLLVQQGNMKLQSVASSATANMTAQAGSIGLVSSNVTSISSEANNIMTKTVASVDSANDLIKDTPNKISSVIDSTTADLADQAEQVSSDIEDGAKSKAKNLDSQTSSVSNSLSSTAKSAIKSSNSSWKLAALKNSADIDSNLRNVNKDISGNASSFRGSVSSELKSKSRASRKVRKSIKSNKTDIKSTFGDLQSGSNAIANDAESQNQEGVQLSSSFTDAIKQKMGSSQSMMSKLFAASQETVGKEVGTTVQSLGEIRSSAASATSQNQQRINAQVAALLNQYGDQSGIIGKQLIDSGNALRSSNDEMDQMISSSADAATQQGKEGAAVILDSLMSLASTMQDSGSSSQEKLQGSISGLQGESQDALKAYQAAISEQGLKTQNLSRSLQSQVDQNQSKFLSSAGVASSGVNKVKGAVGILSKQQAGLLESLREKQGQTDSQLASAADSAGSLDENNSKILQSMIEAAMKNSQQTFGSKESQSQQVMKAAFQSMRTDAEQELLLNKRNLKAQQESNNQYDSQLSDFQEKVSNADSAISVAQAKIDASKASMSGYFQDLQAQNLSDTQKMQSQTVGQYSAQQADVKAKLLKNLKAHLGDSQGNLQKAFGVSSDALSSAASQAAELDQLLNILKQQTSAIPADDSKLKASLTSLAKAQLQDSQAFDSQFSNLNQNFEGIKNSLNSTSIELKNNIKSKIGFIPSILAKDTSALAEQESATEAEISGKVRDLQIKAASAQTQAERDAAEQGLQVLYRIQAVSDTIKSQKSELLSKIAAGETVDSQRFADLQNMMNGLTQSVKIINNNMETQKAHLNQQSEGIAKQASQVFGSISEDIDSVTGRLKNQGQSTFLDSEFNRNLVASKNSDSINQASNSVNVTLALANRHSQDFFDDESMLRSKVGLLKNGTETVSEYLDDELKKAYAFVTDSKQKLQSLVGESASETHTRMSSVKSALHGFLKLWNEYSKYMTEKLTSFNKSDEQTLQSLDLNAKNKIISYETKLSDLIDGISTDYNKLNATITNENDFESMILEHLENLKQQEGSINNQTISTITDINSSISDLEQKLTDGDSKLAEAIKEELDNFDDELNQKQTMAAAGMLNR